MRVPSVISRNGALLTILTMMVLPCYTEACTACMGDPNSRAASAANGAIFLMLGFVALMMGSVGAFIFHLARRSVAPMPPHVELAEAVSTQQSQ